VLLQMAKFHSLFMAVADSFRYLAKLIQLCKV